ncbi:MAG: GNAT family acetyltransferase [Anaerolineales bacterium]|nr:GNAT family acetyltransferase [Anaerolineales bacterium]
MIDIRPYRMDDELEVIQLWKKVFPETPLHNDPLRDIQSKLKIQPGLFLVALDDHFLVGTAMAGYDGHRGWIYYLAVDPAYRRNGIGTALMKKAEGLLAQMSCPKLNLQIRADNSDLQAFYEKLGYSVEERISMGKKL